MDKTNSFDILNGINVNDHTEKKNNLTYLSWAWAWAEMKKRYPNADFEVKKFEGGVPYLYDEKTGYMVFTSVTVDGLTYEMWLPVMDNKNRALMSPTMTDINKSIMRCLAKNLAMFGLGLYIYAGEDLPEGEQSSEPEEPKKSLEELKKSYRSLFNKYMQLTGQSEEEVRAVCEQGIGKYEHSFTAEDYEKCCKSFVLRIQKYGETS